MTDTAERGQASLWPVHACDIYEVKDNKIKEGRAYLDTGAIMSQLGLTEQMQG